MADPVIGSAERAARYGVLHRRTTTDAMVERKPFDHWAELANIERRIATACFPPVFFAKQPIPSAFVPTNPHLVFGGLDHAPGVTTAGRIPKSLEL